MENLRIFCGRYIVGTLTNNQCPNYMEARVCRAPHLFSLPHRANAVAENLGTEGPHTYFSVIRLLQIMPTLLHSITLCLIAFLVTPKRDFE